MSRMALWNMYQNASPPNQQHTTSPPEVQREALNLQRESPSPIPTAPSPIISIKRERDHNEINDYHVPPAKRGLVRTNSEIHRKSSINNNNHHHISNNNSHVTPTKVTSKSLDRSESPNIENGSHHRILSTQHKQQSNGTDNLGTTILNGMQFKIISKGKWLAMISLQCFTNSLSQQKTHQLVNHNWLWNSRWTEFHLKEFCSQIQAHLHLHPPHHLHLLMRQLKRWCHQQKTPRQQWWMKITRCHNSRWSLLRELRQSIIRRLKSARKY